MNQPLLRKDLVTIFTEVGEVKVNHVSFNSERIRS